MDARISLSIPKARPQVRPAGDLTFDPQTLADDVQAVRRIYADFFAELTDDDWNLGSTRGPGEWSLRETVAHLCGLTGAGLESIQATLRGEPYVFAGLTDRYAFNAFNRCGIERHLSLPPGALCAEFLGILDTTSAIARREPPERLEWASRMPIYNRPVKITEAIGIIMFHAGLHHSAQVAEPAGLEPLWQQLAPDIRQRVIGRVLRALSLLYRYDLGGELKATFGFQVDGPGGGNWRLRVEPGQTSSASGAAATAQAASLLLHLSATDVFCQMFTGRLNLPLALLTGQLKLHGDLRLFPRMGSLFSVDARA